MFDRGRAAILVWCLGFLLPALAGVVDTLFEPALLRHALSVPAVMGLALVICWVAAIASDWPLLFRLGFVLLTPLGLIAEFLLMGVAGFMIHGLRGTQ